MTPIEETIATFREKFHLYTMENPRDVWVEAGSDELEDFLRTALESQREEMVKLVEEYMKEELGYENKYTEPIKPTHGTCCTCQECGYANDGECVCSQNRYYKFLSALKDK